MGRFRCQLIINSWLPEHDTRPFLLYDLYRQCQCQSVMYTVLQLYVYCCIRFTYSLADLWISSPLTAHRYGNTVSKVFLVISRKYLLRTSDAWLGQARKSAAIILIPGHTDNSLKENDKLRSLLVLKSVRREFPWIRLYIVRNTSEMFWFLCALLTL